MNKKKKIVMAVVSTVMASAMLVPLAACGGGDDPGPGPNTNAVQPYGARSKTVPTTAYNDTTGAETKDVGTVKIGDDTKKLQLSVKDGKLVYPNTTSLNMNICDGKNKDRQITYTEQISSAAIMPDNYRYTEGDLKPAWWQMSQTLGVKFVNSATALDSGEQITENRDNKVLKNHHIVTGSGSAITENSSLFLNLNDFLDYMPNYKAFLNENEIVKWSLTSDTGSGAMYYAPYFDGNNDIEKYVLTHREWTRAMLDSEDVSAATTTWVASKDGKADVGSNQTYVTPFMGTTGSYSVDTTNPADPTGALIKVKVNYDAAKTAADTAGTPLNTAIKAAYAGFTTATSGNIVDIQNDVIAGTSGEVTGAQLLNILRAYIDVAYQKEDGSKFYTTRSDVFNSTYAAWDVDLLVALSRCVVTSYKLFGDKIAVAANTQIYALAGRQGTSQRRMDLVSFVGELYGVRGLEPRGSDQMYISKDGNLVDARNSSEMYDAMQRMRALTQEGLIYTGDANADKVYSSSKTVLSFLLHDYSQTQTTDGFFAQGIEGLTSSNVISEGDLKFDFAPILTPVSKWDEDESGVIEEDEYFRFTESWRAVKNTGFCVPVEAVAEKPEELSATLAFIDYLFSNDGQIVATYGPRSTNGNSTSKDAPANGFWYATEATGVDINTVAEKYEGSDQYHVKKEYQGQYLIFENKVYESETDYLGRMIPTLTTNNLNYYYGLEVNGHFIGDGTPENGGVGYTKTGNIRSYTNYARGVVGGALPIGNKDQGFEYQATAECGLDGSAVVSVALNNGSIRHLVQEVTDKTNAPDYAKNTYWYTLVPTTLPINTTDGSTLGKQLKLMGAEKAAGMFRNHSKTESGKTNILIDIMFYGYGASGKNICNDSTLGAIPANAAACITKANGFGLDERIAIYAKGWNALKTYYNVV